MVLGRWARGTLPVVIRCRRIWVVKGADLTSSSGEIRPCHGSRELEVKAFLFHRAKPAPSQRAGTAAAHLHLHIHSPPGSRRPLGGAESIL